MNGNSRKDIKIGSRVMIVEKDNQRVYVNTKLGHYIGAKLGQF